MGAGSRSVFDRDDAMSSESLSPRSASPVTTTENFERLEANKKATLGAISSYIAAHAAAPNTTAVKAAAITNIKVAETNLAKLASTGQNYNDSAAIYSSVIESLHQARDNLQGIAWHVGAAHPDGTKDLIRDARGLGPDGKDAPDPNSSVSFTMNYLNVSKGAELMLDDALVRGADKSEITELRKQIRQRAIALVTSLKNGETIDKEAIVHLNHQLVSDLEKIKIGDKKAFENPKKTLNRTKNLTSLADEHCHITTLSTQTDVEGRSRVVAESEVMCLGTTPELARQFESIAKGEADTVKWYQGLPEDSKRILRKFAPQLAAGDKVVSSQLGDYIPGFKNAYTKIVAIGDSERPEHLVVAAEILHSGAVAYLGSEGADEATRDTIAHARSFTGPDDGREVELALHTLNTGGPIKVGVEGRIVDRLEASTGAGGVTVDVVPVNHFRRIASASHDFSDGTLGKFATEFQSKAIREGADAADVKAIVDFIAHGERRSWYNFTTKTDQDKAVDAIKLLRATHPELARAAATAVRLRISRDKFGDKNFRISTEAALVDHELNKMLGEKGRSRKRIFFCKSGKDRTGSVLFRATHLAVSDHLGLTAAEAGDSASKGTMIGNLNRLANVGHTQIMAGRQGGVVGADGILSRVPGRVLDSTTIEVAAKLGYQTANYNKIKTSLKGWLGRKRAADSAVAAGVIKAAKSVSTLSYINPMLAAKAAASAVTSEAGSVEPASGAPKRPVLLTSRRGPRPSV
jgi:hypothetical protein